MFPFRPRWKPVPTEPPRIVRLLRQAEEWRQALDSGVVASRAALARREGCSAMRVTQVLALLDLDGQVLDTIRTLPPGTPERLVTERWLRTLGGAANQSAKC